MLSTYALGAYIATKANDMKWERLLISKGFAEYDKNNVWQLSDIEYKNTLSVKEYVAVLEQTIRNAYEHIEEQAKELVEQEFILKEYKK